MGKYIDGFLIPIKPENIGRYTEIAQKAGELWKEHGALEYIEAAGDDLDAENMVSFTKSAGASDDETVIFAFIVYESKEERDRINALVMADERMKEIMKSGGKEEPFDYTRMSYGGFRAIVEL
jgi:uncharacterized protein YbaA (DUF1428 family)